MQVRTSFALMGLLALLIGGAILGYTTRTRIQGSVTAAGLPVGSAVVRLQGTTHYAVTDANGAFVLSIPFTLDSLHVTASAQGYFITHSEAAPPAALNLTLTAHHPTDNPAYAFISPLDSENEAACMRCHAARRDDAPSLPVEEWQADAHAQSAVNPRFLSMYNGTTLDGHTGEPTAYTFDQTAGVNIPLSPSMGLDDAGAGFRLDFPNSAGTCAACHVPVLALEQGLNADPNAAQGISAEGVTCDFCHKASGVNLGADGLPHLPGVQSMTFLRPSDGEQIFLAQLDDTPGDDVYSPFHDSSQFCAACHSGRFWDVPIYDSYGEWLSSPYSDPVNGQTCQDCHMAPLGVNTFVDLPPDVTQVVPQRDPSTIYSHRMPGASDVSLLQHTAALSVEARRAENTLIVTVSVTNTGAGHAIPTDNPLRNILLVIDARDASGSPLTLLDGAVIPAWGGVGDPSDGNYAGMPGVLYAKILADFFTGETPAFAYWRQTRLISDNRIAPLATDTRVYTFALPPDAEIVTVDARLIFRRAFIDLMRVKGWDTPDIIMEIESVRVE